MNDNEIGDLIITIRATAENLERVVDEAKARLQGIGNAADQTKKPLKDAGKAGEDAGKKMADGAKQAQLAWLALAAAIGLVFRQIGQAIKQGVKDANEYRDALKGLNSVAQASGISSATMEAATEKVVDQFFNAAAAATAYKNLLLRGFSLDQATETIIRLKDAAAFGRQASLSLSQAVTSATEGLKNENSILVDNAGVTKNVAKMWEEYAKSIGVSVAALTQQQKVEAEYLGIRKETAAMTGDIIKLQDSLSGKMAAAENQAYLLSKAYGEAMTPLTAAGTSLKTGFLETLTQIVSTFPGVAAGATTSTAAILGMLIVIPAIQKVITIVKSLQVALAAAGTSLGFVGLIAAVLGAGVAAYTYFANAAEKAREAEEKRAQANRDAVTAEQDRAESLKAMLNSYVELSRKQTLSYQDALSLKTLENDLATQYGITREELDKLVQSTDDYAESLNGVINAATGADALVALQQQAADSLAAVQKSIENNMRLYSEHMATADLYKTTGSGLPGDVEYHLEMAEQAKAKIADAYAQINQWIADELEVVKRQAELNGGKFNTEFSQILTQALIPKIDLTSFDSYDDLIAFFEGMIQKIGNAASGSMSSDAVATIQAVTAKIAKGMVPTDEEILAVQQAWADLFGVDGPIYWYLQDLVDAGKFTKDAVDAVMLALQKSVDPMNLIAASFDATKAGITAYIAAAERARAITNEQADSAVVLTEAQQAAKEKYAELKSEIMAFNGALIEGGEDKAAIDTWFDPKSTVEALKAAAREVDLLWDGTDESRERLNEDMAQKLEELTASTDLLEETRKALMARINEFIVGNRAVLTPDDLTVLDAFYRTLAVSDEELHALQQALKGASEEYTEVTARAEEYYKLLSEQENKAFAVRDWRTQKEELDALTAGTAAYGAKLAEMIATARELGIVFDGTEADLKRTNRLVEMQAAGLSDVAAGLETTRAEIQATLEGYLKDGKLSDAEWANLDVLFKSLDESMARVDTLTVIADFFDGFKEKFNTALEAAKVDIIDNMGYWGDEVAASLSLALRYALNNLGIEDEELADSLAESLINLIASVASEENIEAAQEALSAFTEAIKAGIIPSDEDVEDFIDAWETIFGDESPLILGLEKLVESGEITAEQMEAFKEVLEGMYDPLELLGDTFEETADRALAAAESFGGAADEMSDAEKNIKSLTDEMEGLDDEVKATNATLNKLTGWEKLYKQYKDIAKSGGDVSDSFKDMGKYAKALKYPLENSEASVDGLNQAIQKYINDATTNLPQVLDRLYEIEGELWNVDSISQIDGNVEIDVSAALLAVAALIKALQDAIDLASQLGGVETGGRRGGGGSKKSTPSGGGGGGVSKSAYDVEIEKLEHLKALDQLTYEQELAHLEEISRKAIADAEERLDLEERIYDVKKSIRERDAENLTDLTDALIDALEERYDAMRKAETEALDQSREAWKEWRDHNVAAIEDQIDALDALDKAEDRQETKEEHLRKIAMLEQSLAYEQDSFNQLQLQKQVDEAKADYDEWQRKTEREDQKAALEAQIDAINDRADTEIALLDQQQEAIEAYYDERTTQANLQAEAQLELMNSTQQKIIDLLTQYAPDYDAAGRSLGERFMAGFTSVFGTFNDWFNNFEGQVSGAVDQLQAANVAAAEAARQTQIYDENGNPVSGIVINQENNFYTLTETPAETARRIQQANEDLAAQIAGE